MHYQNITTDRQLQQYCRELSGSESIAIDTEFVSEHTYRPVLCLVQVAAGGQPALIDAMAIDNLRPFWETIVEPGHETIVHAGRGEMQFCLEAIDCFPDNLFDVQIAAGLVGVEYPAGYGALIKKLLGRTPNKHETRTDWRRRPLSGRQIEYALEDACYLQPLRDKLHAKLQELGRLGWLAEEMAAWRDEIERYRSRQRWRRTLGNSGLDGRGLAIVRELWQWREAEAQRRDTPVRRVLRDDLIIELARRRTAEVQRIRAVRGLERGDLRRRLDEIAACIRRALDMPEGECPKTVPRERGPQHSVLGQFLFAALGSLCRQAQLAPNLVGTPNDIRHLIAHRTGQGIPGARGQGSGVRGSSPAPTSTEPPKLARGWRADLVGHLFDDLLAGKRSIRIGDPTSDHPLVFEPNQGGE